MRTVTHLSLEERLTIETYLKNNPNASLLSLVRFMKRNAKTIAIEVNRNGGKIGYNAKIAHEKALSRQNRRGPYSKLFTTQEIATIEDLLAKNASKFTIYTTLGCGLGRLNLYLATRNLQQQPAPQQTSDSTQMILEILSDQVKSLTVQVNQLKELYDNITKN